MIPLPFLFLLIFQFNIFQLFSELFIDLCFKMVYDTFHDVNKA